MPRWRCILVDVTLLFLVVATTSSSNVGDRYQSLHKEYNRESYGMNGWSNKSLTQMSARQGHTMNLFQGSLWILGGEGYNSEQERARYNDVWSAKVTTSALPTFNLELESASWPARAWHQAISFQSNQTDNEERLWIFGGASQNCNPFPCEDIWSSNDGITWDQHYTANMWPGRYAHASVAHDGQVYIFGGIGMKYDSLFIYSDVWATRDPGGKWNPVIESLTPRNACHTVGIGCGGWVGQSILNLEETPVNPKEICAIGSVYEGDQFGASVVCATATDPTNGSEWKLVNTNPGWLGRVFHQVVVVDSSSDDSPDLPNSTIGVVLMGGSFWDSDWKIENMWTSWNIASCPTPDNCPLPAIPEYVPPKMYGLNDLWLWPKVGDTKTKRTALRDQRSASALNDDVDWVSLGNAPWGVRSGHAAESFEGRIFLTGGSNENSLYGDLWCYGCSPPKPPSSTGGNSNIQTYAIVGLSAIAIMGIFLAAIFRRWRCYKDSEAREFAYRPAASSPRHSRRNSEEEALFNMMKESHESSAWLLDAAKVALGEEIARGSAGWVFRGIYANTEVAIKQLRTSHWDTHLSHKAVFREVAILSRVRHPNIVRMYGVALRSPYVLIVMEYCPQSLGDWIRARKKSRFASSSKVRGAGMHSSFSAPATTDAGVTALVTKESIEGDLKRRNKAASDLLKEQLRLAREICMGMAHLHSVGIVHRDLKPENVLLDASDRVMLCDFGVSRLIAGDSSTLKTTLNAGSPLFMAPELLNGIDEEGKGVRCSSSVDVYAFGIVSWMLFTLDEPYAGSRTEQMSPLAFMNAVCEGMRPDPTCLPASLRGLIARCWHGSASMRPTFPEIADALGSWGTLRRTYQGLVTNHSADSEKDNKNERTSGNATKVTTKAKRIDAPVAPPKPAGLNRPVSGAPLLGGD